MTKPPTQCITLAVVCDIVRSGEAIGQLVTWRANLGASNVVKFSIRYNLRI